jgi:hypothetical protein
MKYVQRKDGEGFTVRNREVFKLACCDCGLVHNFSLYVPGKRRGTVIGIAAERNERATAAKRRKR